MIPKNIKKEHIIEAIAEIKKVGISEGRNSRKYLLEYDGGYFPPKFVISLANKYANSELLDSQEFNGGVETNNFLKNLGFNVVEEPSKISITKPLKKNRRNKVSIDSHNERCAKCKETVKRLLEKMYGKVEQNYKFEIGTQPEDLKNTPYYDKLKEIYEALKTHSGFKEFVKSKTLRNCDFFIPNPGFIVEFDETQHFTEPRRIALEKYPEELELGFDRERWIKLCMGFNAKDNDPIYRDEQRAWYDTLRDFLPAIKGLKPTVRLFAKDYVWCSFDPDNQSDVKKFENLLKGGYEGWEIEIKEEQDPSIARVIIAGEWEGNLKEAWRLIEDICEKWPKDKKVKFLITCGGFLQFDWPESISWNDIGDNKNPNHEAINKLIEKATEYVSSVLNDDLCRRLSEVTDYITLGVDSVNEKISTTHNRLHVELVFLKDLKQGNLFWTGKSYPTPAQQDGLVRIVDLQTHFVNLDVGKVMILGCHDLNIFNPRSINAKEWRKKVKEDFKKLAKNEESIYALHHPHTTVKRRTWLTAWSSLRKTLT